MPALAALTLLVLAPLAHAQDTKIQYGGSVQADIRFAIPKADRFPLPWYAPQPDIGPGIARDELRWTNKLYARTGHFGAKANVALVLPGYTQDLSGLQDMTQRPKVGPVYFEANELYIEGYDLFPGFDLRVGNQVVDWGAGDRFNPTNTVNPNDLEDVLLFGEQVGNLMARADYTPKWWLTFTGIYVPVFRPALLPASAVYAFANTDRLPWYDENLRLRVQAENAAASQLFGYPTVVAGTTVQLPDVAPRNGQFALRVGALAGPVNVALSYYNGLSDTPVPIENHTTQTQDPRCAPFGGPCVNGTLDNQVTLGFPHMQVIGLNLEGDAKLGYRLEAGLFFPERTPVRITNGELSLGPVQRPAGEYPYPSGQAPLAVGRPFAKWTLGVDYTFGKHVYANVQWVHGFPGEFGAGDWISPGWSVVKGGVTSDASGTLSCALGEDGTQRATETLRPRKGDFIVAGIDIHLLPVQALLIRLFGIADLSGGVTTRWDEASGSRVTDTYSVFDPQVFSGVIYPEVSYNFGNGLELDGGVLLQVGQAQTQFGDPQTGGSMVFTRAKFSY